MDAEPIVPTVRTEGHQLSVPCSVCAQYTTLWLPCCKAVPTCQKCPNIARGNHGCPSSSLAATLQSKGQNGMTLVLGPMVHQAMCSASANMDVVMQVTGDDFDNQLIIGKSFNLDATSSKCLYLVYHVPMAYVNDVVRAIYGHVVLVRGEWRGVRGPVSNMEYSKICDRFGNTYSLLDDRESILRANYVMMSAERVPDQTRRSASYVW